MEIQNSGVLGMWWETVISNQGCALLFGSLGYISPDAKSNYDYVRLLNIGTGPNITL